MDERLRFVARLLDGEKMAPLCREFGISRPTGYKIFTRYKDLASTDSTDRRPPYRHANKLPFQVERTILALKREHPAGAHRRSARSSSAGLADDQGPGEEHHPRRARSARSGQAAQTPSATRPRARA